MNVLIVFAHPERRSFNSALKDIAVDKLQSLGHSIELSDLYEMRWNPLLGPNDFSHRADDSFLDLSREQEHAFGNNAQCLDIETEQAKVARADFLLLHFPIWWFSMPAILKGWVDRVFSRGFAYSAGHKYDTGHFKGKQAMLCVTTGTAGTLYEPNGIDGDLNQILWPIHNGTRRYTGFTVLPPFAAWMPGNVSPAERENYLSMFADRLMRLDETTPLFFHPRSDYDDTQRLKPGVLARSGFQWNP